LTDDDKEANEDLPGMGGVYNPINLAVYHYAGNNPIVLTDPDGRTIWRWIGRNWLNVGSAVLSGIEIGVGVAGETETFGVSTLLIIHGAANEATVGIKMTVTSIIANSQGDDAADEVEHNLPSTALGMVSYGVAYLAVKLSGNDYKGQQFKSAAGAIFDMIDAGIGLGMGLKLGKEITKALDRASPEAISALQKYYLANEKNIISKYGQAAATAIADFLGIKDTANKINDN